MTPPQPPLILIAEDEVLVAQDIEACLQRLGYRTLGPAASRDQALELARQQRPDLALLDIHLKGPGDGIEVSQHLTANLNVPSIFLTAYSDQETLRKVKASAPYAYVLKPFDERELQMAIEVALERHQMQSRIRRSEEWFATTLECIGDGVIASDLENRVIYMNHAAEKITGWQMMEARGKELTEVLNLIEEGSGQAVPSPSKEALARNMVVGLANTVLLKQRQGKEIPVGDAAAPVRNRSGEVTGAVIVFRDETVAREASAQKARIDRMEGLGIIAGGMAHDFNNLMAIIQTNLEVLELQSAAPSNGQAYLKEIKSAAERAAEMSRRFITFAKGAAPMRCPEPLEPLLTETIRPIVTGTPVSARFEIEHDLCPGDVDRIQLERVVSNLALNAVQAMPTGGTLTVRGRNLPTSELRQLYPLLPPERKFIEISITDEGVGIPPDMIERIFNPFFTTKAGGSGLGLGVVQSIIQKHGGALRITSKVGAGSTFYFALPAASKEASIRFQSQPLSNGKLSGSRERRKRVLYVDDEPQLRKIVSHLLDSVGYEVVTASESQEALALFQQRSKNGSRFDVVICDVVIPGSMSGMDVAAELYRMDPTVRILLVSGYDREESLLHDFHRAGICGILHKPFRIDTLCSKIKNILEEPVLKPAGAAAT